MKKNVLKIMLGTVITEVILVCVLILMGTFNDTGLKAIASVGIIFIFSIPCLFYSRISDNPKYKPLVSIGSILVLIVAVTTIISLWGLFKQGDLITNILGTANVIIWLLAYISWVIEIISVNKTIKNTKIINIVISLILSIWNIIEKWIDKNPEGFLLRLLWVLIILQVGGFICLLILKRIYKKELQAAKEAMNRTNEDSLPKPAEDLAVTIRNIDELNASNESTVNPNNNNLIQ